VGYRLSSVSSLGVSARCSLSRLGRPVAPVNTLGGSRVDPLGHPFDAIGMDAFGERPRRKLVATSEKVRKRSPEKRKVLTAQEEQIGRLARDGLSNPEISGQIFITARTVEWHLRKEFTKLGGRVSTRSCELGTLARCRLGRASCDSSSFRCRGRAARGPGMPMEGRVGAPLALV
jgi:DNA-binding CsgD family transcriptional regulator